MFILIIILSYLLGCASTIALLLYLYTRYALQSSTTVNEQHQEQFQTFQPLPENERAKNSAVDAVNYLFQFLFQELKDSSRLRRYILHKLNTEFKELKTSRTGRIFLQNIVIQNFSIGKECPTFSDIQLERQERDERNLIKTFVAHIDADYENGFSVQLDITLLFGQKCVLFIKVKRIQGKLRLEFRREPFCHWLLVFQDEPLIDFDVKSSFATLESPQLAQIITQQLRRAIKRKQTWPSYKIRFQPFFSMSKQSIPTDILSSNGNSLIPGTFDVLIKHCDRLLIPFGIFDKQKISSIPVFLTINVNESTCSDYLYLNREQWPTKEIELIRNLHKIIVKEVMYMDHTELLIEELDPIPNGIEDIAAFQSALEDKNVYLIKIQGQEVKTAKQTNRLLKYKSMISPNESSTPSTTNNNDDNIQIVVAMPILHSVRVQRFVEINTNGETEKQGLNSPTLSVRSETSSISTPALRHRLLPQTVKFEKSPNTIVVQNKPTDEIDDEQVININLNDSSTKIQDSVQINKIKQVKTSVNDITLIMMNADTLKDFQARPTPTQKADSYIEFNERFEFQVGSNEKYLNICLWCKPPLDSNVTNAGKKLVLLGHTCVALSEIVLDSHMSYKRETQMTLNFRPAYSSKTYLNVCLTDSESKKRLELSTHKGFDENLAYGFVTINVKHRSDIEKGLNPQEKKEAFLGNEPILSDIYTKLREEEKKQDQLKYINFINEQRETPARKQGDHMFEDQTFTVATVCACCNRKIWMKVGRQCRDCSVAIHKKCEDKFNAENICTRESNTIKTSSASTPNDDEQKCFNNIEISALTNTPVVTCDDVDVTSIKPINESLLTPSTVRTTTAHRISTKAAAAFSVLDSTARRSFRAFGNKNVNQTNTSLTPNLSSTSELSKSDESLNDPTANSTKKSTTDNPQNHTSSKLVNAASSAYSKLRELKSKRLPAMPEVISTNKTRPRSNSSTNTNIPEADLRDIINKCLSDDGTDGKNLENLLHEKAVDESELYAKAREFGSELFREYTPDERKQKLDNEISRLQQEIDLQCRIRDEMTIECQSPTIDENEKRKLFMKISNIDEKIQALGALTIFYCSGLKHCCQQIERKSESNQTPTNESPDEDDDYDDPQDDNDEEYS